MGGCLCLTATRVAIRRAADTLPRPLRAAAALAGCFIALCITLETWRTCAKRGARVAPALCRNIVGANDFSEESLGSGGGGTFLNALKVCVTVFFAAVDFATFGSTLPSVFKISLNAAPPPIVDIESAARITAFMLVWV